MNLLPPNAPPVFESIYSFFDGKLQESKSSESNQQPFADRPPAYQDLVKQDAFIIAQNQVTLVADDPERTVMEQIDTEQHFTIRQIREYLRRQQPHVRQIQLTYRDRVLNDNDTLASLGWDIGECGTITVHTNT